METLSSLIEVLKLADSTVAFTLLSMLVALFYALLALARISLPSKESRHDA